MAPTRTASTGASRWTVIVPCSASATQTVLCAATFGNQFCPMTRSCKHHWKASLSAPVSIAVRNFRLTENGCTAPSSVRSLPAVSRMRREYGNSETSESNHLPLRNPKGSPHHHPSIPGDFQSQSSPPGTDNFHVVHHFVSPKSYCK